MKQWNTINPNNSLPQVGSAGASAGVNLAYLIVAHHQPHHLARLIQALNHENAYFFIHIDRKVNITPFQQCIPPGPNITFISNRVKVYWAGLSVVTATLRLLETAVKAGLDFRYYTLLSGSDYPIKHKDEIYTRFQQAADSQFISVGCKLTRESGQEYFRKIENYHLLQDTFFFNARATHRFMASRQWMLKQLYRLTKKILPKRTGYKDLTPYMGSMYWSLTANCVRFILDFVKNEPGYTRFHRFVHAPDEIFFHTLVKHSPFAEAITHDFEKRTPPDNIHHANHFIDWQGLRQRDYLTLDERDFEDLLRSEAWFARKFDEGKSDKLLTLLDEQVHHIEIEQVKSAWRRNHEPVESRTMIIQRNPDGWGGIADVAMASAHAQEIQRPQASGEPIALVAGNRFRPARRTDPPPVSCICPTYGRVALLEEAIYCFLQQDYPGPKELIVLNDYMAQTLIFDHPEVRVINLPQRFRTMGEKRNAGVAMASHDLLFPWDDDDIYLPHRLSYSVAKFEVQKGFFKPGRGWFWTNGHLDGPVENRFHTSSCWSRNRFDAVRGYGAAGSGEDMVFEQRLERQFPGSTRVDDIQPEAIYYIYRWSGTGSYHLSQFGDYCPGSNIGHHQVEAFVRQQARRGEIRQGRITLQPHWRTDYQQLVSNYIATLAAEQVPGRY
ncbi:MAG: glycosyltransferase [Anaerolineae bacterium]|nr:glycosyltransferase [Anaerolineae bacterium]MCB9108321.1 glycosyltransferase [Anaerolineales bacterium]